MTKFKERYNISLQILNGESGSVDKEKVEEDRKLIKNYLNKYQSCDIYNMDETALFFIRINQINRRQLRYMHAKFDVVEAGNSCSVVRSINHVCESEHY